MIEHRDEDGQPCARHPAPSRDALLALAAVGARMPGFHHDAASKLQGLMMALDEITDLAESAAPELRQATESAQAALRALHQLFTANRALGKPAQRTRIALGELVAKAAERAGVKIRGELAAVDLELAVPATTHALATLLDLCAGPAQLGRVVTIEVTTSAARATLVLAGPEGAAAKSPPDLGESIAIATFLIARGGGELRCGPGERFRIELAAAGG